MAKRYTETMIGFKKEMEHEFNFSEDELVPIVIEYELVNPIAEHLFIDSNLKTTCFTSYTEDFARFTLKNRLQPQTRVHDFDLI